MKKKLILICPICGGKDLVEQEDGTVLCWDCGQEIIPLVTPQEET